MIVVCSLEVSLARLYTLLGVYAVGPREGKIILLDCYFITVFFGKGTYLPYHPDNHHRSSAENGHLGLVIPVRNCPINKN